MDFEGNHLYTWNVPRELPDGYLEVHTFSVDSDGNFYGGDNQYGRTQKFVPKPDAERSLLIGPPWVAQQSRPLSPRGEAERARLSLAWSASTRTSLEDEAGRYLELLDLL